MTEGSESGHEILVVRDFFEVGEVGEVTESSCDGEPLFESVERFWVIGAMEIC